jgi:hypothetical protein
MTLRLYKIDREGPVPPGLELFHLHRCEHCVLWERSHYHVVGTCRRYPYPRMHAWERCPLWNNRHGRSSILDDWSRGGAA